MIFMDESPRSPLRADGEAKEVGQQGEIDVADMVRELENKIKAKRKEIYANLTGWRKSTTRHPERPYTLYYVTTMCKKFGKTSRR